MRLTQCKHSDVIGIAMLTPTHLTSSDIVDQTSELELLTHSNGSSSSLAASA